MTAVSQSLTVRVPLAIRRRGGRKIVVTPEGEAVRASTPPRARVDSDAGEGAGRAHRWKRLLENGTYASISELAKAEKIDRGYLGRILQLTLLAPDIVEAILDGRQPTGARAAEADGAVPGAVGGVEGGSAARIGAVPSSDFQVKSTGLESPSQSRL